MRGVAWSAAGDEVERGRAGPPLFPTPLPPLFPPLSLLTFSPRIPLLSPVPPPTEGPWWGYPMLVLGAVCPFLEPFCGHLSPKVDKSSKNGFWLRYRRALRGSSAALHPSPPCAHPSLPFLPVPTPQLPNPMPQSFNPKRLLLLITLEPRVE